MSKALDRAQELMNIPENKLPKLAREFRDHLCAKSGLSAECALTAFAVYAQCAEGLPCDDQAYEVTAKDDAWFLERIKTVVAEPKERIRWASTDGSKWLSKQDAFSWNKQLAVCELLGIKEKEACQIMKKFKDIMEATI